MISSTAATIFSRRDLLHQLAAVLAGFLLFCFCLFFFRFVPLWKWAFSFFLFFILLFISSSKSALARVILRYGPFFSLSPADDFFLKFIFCGFCCCSPFFFRFFSLSFEDSQTSRVIFLSSRSCTFKALDGRVISFLVFARGGSRTFFFCFFFLLFSRKSEKEKEKRPVRFSGTKKKESERVGVALLFCCSCSSWNSIGFRQRSLSLS